MNDDNTTRDATPVRRRPRALVIVGLSVAAVLTLGVAFAAGVGVGHVLPGHGGPMIGALGAGHTGDRGDRGDRSDRIDDRRELFEQWLEQQDQNG